jgi:hypothetical protein
MTKLSSDKSAVAAGGSILTPPASLQKQTAMPFAY